MNTNDVINLVRQVLSTQGANNAWLTPLVVAITPVFGALALWIRSSIKEVEHKMNSRLDELILLKEFNARAEGVAAGISQEKDSKKDKDANPAAN
jgi:hypothetical protein